MEQAAAFCWSTDESGQKERFDYWREAICAAFDPMSPELEKCDRDTFRGTVSAWRLDFDVDIKCSPRALHRVPIAAAELQGRTRRATQWAPACNIVFIRCVGSGPE